MRVVTIIPALNEEGSIGKVIKDIPKDLVDEVVVVDNGSSDRTADVAQELGATVLSEPRKGYGYACLAGIEHVSALPPGEPVIVVFLDGDYSDYPEDMTLLLDPIIKEDYDLVIGSRLAGDMDPEAMGVHSKLATKTFSRMLSILLREKITDLGPFRAITLEALRDLKMKEKLYGWTVEMIVKAVQKDLKILEVPVKYRKRIGKAKISGGVKSSIKALSDMVRSLLMSSLEKGRK
jgi:glycosyltransferase involved in cell wall biosynthesis